MEQLELRIIELEREVVLQREVILAMNDELDAIHTILKPPKNRQS